MQCPGCKDALVALEMHEVEVDWCASCKGVWLDRGELELLHGDSAVAKKYLSDLKPSPTAHGNRRCPICRSKLKAVQSAWESSVVLDECSNGDGLWFDGGELARALEDGGAGDKVQKFMSGIFSAK